ncbi:MAG: oligosaccharide flippase family protein [Patescibacteria group bacterium]|nr:oligosaccharide flippase family protein [Patescibacteria group bacterium]
MFDQFKRLFKHSFIYAIGSLAQSVVGFILIPMYTRYLSPADYGQLEILNTLILILSMLLSFGFASALFKCYERDCKTDIEQKQLVGTAFLFIIPLATLSTLILWLFRDFIANTFLGGTQYADLVNLLLITNLFAVFLALAFSVMRAEEKSLRYIIFSLLKFILVLGLNVYFVVYAKMGVFGIMLGNFIAQVFISVPFIFNLIPYFKFSFSKHLLKRLFAFGVPIIPASLAMWIMDLSDRYFLKIYDSLSEVGLYSLGYKIGFIVSILLVTPFQLAWPTISFSVAKRADTKQIYARTLTYWLLVSSFIALAISIFAKQIVEVVSSPEYFEAYKIIPLIAFSYVLYGMHFVIVPGLHLEEKTKYYPLLVGIPAVLNIILNIIFIPKYGMMAAAWSTFICFVLMVVLTYFVSNYYYKVVYEWMRMIKLVLISGSLLVLSYLTNTFDFYTSIFMNLGLLVLFFILLFAFRFFRNGEIEQIKLLLNKKTPIKE